MRKGVGLKGIVDPKWPCAGVKLVQVRRIDIITPLFARIMMVVIVAIVQRIKAKRILFRKNDADAEKVSAEPRCAITRKKLTTASWCGRSLAFKRIFAKPSGAIESNWRPQLDLHHPCNSFDWLHEHETPHLT